MISTCWRNSVRTGVLVASSLLVGGGCQSSTEPSHKPLVALPSWLGGSTPAQSTSTTLVAAPAPAPAPAQPAFATPPPAMRIDTPATQPVTTATTTFVEHPSFSGATLSTMPTTVATTQATSPSTSAKVVAPITVPNPTMRPVASESVAVAPSAPQPPAVDPNAGVVAHKPFIAVSRWFGHKPSPGAQPSVLLQQHARSDSPVPLSDYSKQPTYALASFPLRASLSAAELSRRLGPPAQLADYASPWYVYRLGGGQELWLHFAQPDEQTLLAADVIRSAEDGYTRNRVFSLFGMP